MDKVKTQIEEKSQLLKITANIDSTTANASLKRQYEIQYQYYDIGGWKIDTCTAINQNEWTAKPNSIDISKEEIANYIFQIGSYNSMETHYNGYIMQNVENANYWRWNEGNKASIAIIDNIKRIEENLNSEIGEGDIIAYCTTTNGILELNETIKIHCKFIIIFVKEYTITIFFIFLLYFS